ncbi:MAG: hypothetical protein H0T69_09655 [Thermoleophilaceae bacterium]|nr:hypothetical protein [Thermoleophilaceae bacterium]
MSREAVLLQWERKIEAAERLDAGERPDTAERPAAAAGGRFARADEDAGSQEDATEDEFAGAAVAQPVQLRPVEDSTQSRSRRFVRTSYEPRSAPQAVAERRTITITGQSTPARRRRAVVDSQLAQPDRIALWAFLLGLLLVAVAAGTAHA